MRIVFMGTPQAAVPSLEKLIVDGHEIVAVYTQPDRPVGRGNKLTAPPVRVCALANNLTVFQPTKIKTSEALELFQSHQADVAVVVAYGRILPQTFLESYPKGCLNVHFSLLPKYRGAAPVNWAIVNGETETGVTTMQMDAGLDTGDILLQRKTEILPDENAIELMNRLSFFGANLISETLQNLNQITPRPQNNEEATFAPLMKKEDGRIDWNLPAGEITNRVRGFQPFPTSYTSWQGKKLTIWKAKESKLERDEIPHGSVLAAKGDLLLVSSGNNTVLEINELQLEGKNRLKTRDFLNGIKIQLGDKFE